MSENNRFIWFLVGGASLLLLAVLASPSLAGAEPYKRKGGGSQRVCWTECRDGEVLRPPGALALSLQRPSPWQACQEKCAELPLVQKEVVAGHEPPACPEGWSAVYDQNTAEWACTDAPSLPPFPK